MPVFSMLIYTEVVFSS